MSQSFKILDVKPAGFRVFIEHDLEDLKKLALAINCAEFDITKVDVAERNDVKESVNWVINNFFPDLKRFLKEIDDGS
jgi:NADP-dependent 3-hydroxy acid dehydrogenase YdfG